MKRLYGKFRGAAPHLAFLFSVFTGLMFLLSIFRFVLYLMSRPPSGSVEGDLLIYAFFNRGLLFDAATCSFLLLLPFLMLSSAYLSGSFTKKWIKASLVLLFLLILVILLTAVADIPFFLYFNARLNRSILAWTDDLPLMFEALFGTPVYILYFLVFILISFLLWKGLLRLMNRVHLPGTPLPSFFTRLPVFLASGFLIFIGIRGDIDPGGMPLQPKHAFETNTPYINQLGLNATFNFIYSFEEKRISYFSDREALSQVQGYLGVEPGGMPPLAREVLSSEHPRRANVLVVIMESMSASQMSRHGNPGGLTPVLDSLALRSLNFDNAFTAGTHTYNGVFSTLFALPALVNHKPTMSSGSASRTYAGLPNVLSDKGYACVFFTNGPKEFDNFGGVLPPNGFDQIVDQQSFSQSDILNNWGVGDHVLFAHSLPLLDSLAFSGQSFLGVYMTVSTHKPYTLPDDIGFEPTAGNARDRSYQYADWSIGQFLQSASGRPWFDSTLFVFVADHGQNFDPLYELPLTYFHTPMFFYAPAFLAPETRTEPALQIDIFPTVMGILGMPYVNNTLGLDLMRQKRPYAYFCADHGIGVIDGEDYLILGTDGREGLFSYKNRSLENRASGMPAKVKSMKDYALAMMQSMQVYLEKGYTSAIKSKHP